MSPLEDRIPLLNRCWDALEAGDLDGFMELVRTQTHPDCEFHSGIGSMVGGGTYKGPEGIRSWFSDLLATTSERRWENRRYETFGDDVLIFLADLTFVGAASGAEVVGQTGAVAEFENGLCVRMDSFMSHDEAREFAEARVA
jgi:ketosteroid isomerase-like protein